MLYNKLPQNTRKQLWQQVFDERDRRKDESLKIYLQLSRQNKAKARRWVQENNISLYTKEGFTAFKLMWAGDTED